MDPTGTFLALLALAFLFYMVPTIVADRRRHKAVASIAVVNFLLGWTIIGWIAALAWAVGPNVEPPELEQA